MPSATQFSIATPTISVEEARRREAAIIREAQERLEAEVRLREELVRDRKDRARSEEMDARSEDDRMSSSNATMTRTRDTDECLFAQLQAMLNQKEQEKKEAIEQARIREEESVSALRAETQQLSVQRRESMHIAHQVMLEAKIAKEESEKKEKEALEKMASARNDLVAEMRNEMITLIGQERSRSQAIEAELRSQLRAANDKMVRQTAAIAEKDRKGP